MPNLPLTNGGVDIPKIETPDDGSPEAAPVSPSPEPLSRIEIQESTVVLNAAPLATQRAVLGSKPPGMHHLQAAPSRPLRKRDSTRIGLIQTVLRQRVPECRERFPTAEEMSNQKLQIKGRKALEKDPRTRGPDWEFPRIRKSFMRAVGREKRK
jgi:hypothetical protein